MHAPYVLRSLLVRPGTLQQSVSSSGDMVVRGVRCLYAPRLRHTLRGGAVFVMCRLIFKALVA